jgi:hypothetical protein
MEDVINVPGDKNKIGDIVSDEAEMLISSQMGQVVFVSGDEVVQPDHIMTFGDKPIGQVRT